MTFATTISIIIILLGLLVTLMKRKYTFWKNRNVQTPPFKFGWGNFQDPILQRRCFSDTLKDFYRFFKSRQLQHGGLYSFIFPVYVPIDLDIIKSILLVDFDHFAHRGFYMNEVDDPLSATIFALNEDKWRWVRAKFSPAFSPAKLKVMFDSIMRCGEEFADTIGEVCNEAVDITEVNGGYTMNIIGQCAFGIECNSLKEPKNEYIVNGTAFFERSLLENIKIQLTEIVPELMKKLHISITRPSVTDFYKRLTFQAMEYREKNKIVNNDLLDLLIKMKNMNESNDDVDSIDKTCAKKLPFGEIVGLAYSMFLASFETTSIAISFTLYLLASHRDIQEKARDEVIRVMKKYNGKLTYESMSEFVYLDMVIDESMRLYPPVHHLYRMCTKDYKVPGTDLILRKGQKVFVPVIGIHHDEEYYPDPEKFDPERFSTENSNDRNPITFMPFGIGPKYCLAQRFGLLQVKIALIMVLQRFEMSTNEKTKNPLEFSTGNHITLFPKDGIWLNMKKIIE
ncbi:probable cytochrome P450 6a13 [Harmonia axyridis]|uniref:probable cytochrome P450 6a13 n=1 Tax=Harmonia axyridis TaxID=115357 RepID=UPI001E27576F|nr:probable cytochrome P450 6a13 [Harmonia axyridis]